MFFDTPEELLAEFDTIIFQVLFLLLFASLLYALAPNLCFHITLQKSEPQLTKIFHKAPVGKLEITSTPMVRNCWSKCRLLCRPTTPPPST